MSEGVKWVEKGWRGGRGKRVFFSHLHARRIKYAWGVQDLHSIVAIAAQAAGGVDHGGRRQGKGYCAGERGQPIVWFN